jgi:hypothetical protein
MVTVLHYVVENKFIIMSNVFHNSGLRCKEKNGSEEIQREYGLIYTIAQ